MGALTPDPLRNLSIGPTQFGRDCSDGSGWHGEVIGREALADMPSSAFIDAMAARARLRDAMPTVTIVTPSLNQGRFIEETLRSVAEQDYAQIEHLIVDGGSTDGTLDVLESWTAHPISWISEPDGGQADAIQKGFDRASGRIVAWLNADDIYLTPSAVSAVVAAFVAGAKVVTGAGRYLSEDGVRLNQIRVRPDRLSNRRLRYADHVLQPATFFSRSAVSMIRLDETLHWAFDWDFFIRVADAVEFTPIYRELAGYRLHSSAKTVSGGAARKRELLRVVERYHGRRSFAYIGGTIATEAVAVSERIPSTLGKIVRRIVGLSIEFIDWATQGHGLQG